MNNTDVSPGNIYSKSNCHANKGTTANFSGCGYGGSVGCLRNSSTGYHRNGNLEGEDTVSTTSVECEKTGRGSGNDGEEVCVEGRKIIGLVAQEVRQVLPGAVIETVRSKFRVHRNPI